MQKVQKHVFIMNLNLALPLKDVTPSVRIYATDTKNSKGRPQNNIRGGKNAR